MVYFNSQTLFLLASSLLSLFVQGRMQSLPRSDPRLMNSAGYALLAVAPPPNMLGMFFFLSFNHLNES